MQNPVAGSAAVAQGMVYIGSLDGFLYALDAATGSASGSSRPRNSPSPPAFSAGTLFVSSTEDPVCPAPGTGYTSSFHCTRPSARDTLLWPTDWSISPLEVRYTRWQPMRVDPGQYQLQLVWAQLWIWQFPVPRPPAQPGSRWRFLPETSPWEFSAPAVAPEAFYVGDTEGYLYARDALTGEGLWQFRPEAPDGLTGDRWPTGLLWHR